MSGLLVSRLRIELEPDNITGLWNVGHIRELLGPKVRPFLLLRDSFRR